ncbi:MAG: sulfate ABC transporter ATP-binding protein [Desulfuromonadia bacterium]
MSIRIEGVTKRFGSFTALSGVSLSIPTGELVALLGPSGCGKTSLLRIIAGLESPDEGRVLFHGEDSTNLAVAKRNVGFVFQHYALFRHMTVFDNVAFGLTVRPRKSRPSKSEIRERVMRLLSMVQVDFLADRYPSQLSGGQRQRVALARALAVEPQVLLLDEPFGALDAQIRVELRRWLRRLHDQLHVTSVFVTHDQEEALEVADRVVVMNRGRIEQEGRPEEVYENPASPFVMNFLGSVNLFHGRIPRLGGTTMDPRMVSYVRSHDIEIERTPRGEGAIPALVTHLQPRGGVVRVILSVEESEMPVEAEIPREVCRSLSLEKGERVWLHPRRVTVFPLDYQI